MCTPACIQDLRKMLHHMTFLEAIKIETFLENGIKDFQNQMNPT